MNWRSRFRDELKRTLYYRAHPIFHELDIKKLSKPTEWTREYRSKRITKLLSIAERIILPEVLKELYKYISPPKIKKMTGRKHERGHRIIIWAKANFGENPILYSFWKGKKCIYVGVGETTDRLQYYKDSGKFLDRSEANMIKVSSVKGKSYLHLVECLANHIYQPTKNRIKSQQKRYSKKCPMCQAINNIENTLNKLLD